MQIEITTRNIERPELHRVAAARAVEQALERFAGRVSRVVVTIADINGPRGGRDKHCTIRLDGPRFRAPVVVSATDESVRQALSRAAYRAVRATMRRIERAGGRTTRGARVGATVREVG